jgi:hypothetical protein
VAERGEAIDDGQGDRDVANRRCQASASRDSKGKWLTQWAKGIELDHGRDMRDSSAERTAVRNIHFDHREQSAKPRRPLRAPRDG